MTSIEPAREFVALTKRKRALEAELKAINAEIAQIEPAVLDFFSEIGEASMKLDGMTIYTRADKRARALDPELAAASLKKLGFGMLVKETVNANTLSSWVRDELAEHGRLPDGLEGIEVIDTVMVVGRER